VNTFRESLAVLRIRDYRYFLLSRFLATLATQMQALVVAWQVYQLTKDPLALGLIGGVEAAVFMAFALWAGHVADRHEKRRIIFITQFVLLACTAGFWFMSDRESVTLLALYALIGITGLARSFMWPASFSYSELTVPKAIYSRAATLNTTGWEIGSIAGPAMGGLLYAWKGPALVYAVVAVLMGAAIFFTGLLSPKPPVAHSETHAAKDFWAGLRFVFSNKMLLGAMSLDMFAVLFGGVYAILPIFADAMGVGAVGLGWLRAAPSLGAVAMAIFIASRPAFQQAGRVLFVSVAAFGVFTLGFSAAGHFNSYAWALAFLALSGMADNVSVIIRSSVIQAHTPDPMRGRVASVNGLFIGSSNVLGALESGIAAKLLGVVPSVVFGGLMTLASVAFIAWKVPALRRLNVIHKSNPE